MRRCIHIAPLTLIVLLAMMHEARAQAPDAGVPPVVGASEEATTAIAAPARRFSPDGKPLTTLIFPPGQQVQIDSILAKIRTDTGITVEARGQARGQPIPSPLLKDATVEEAVRWIASQRDLMYYQESPTVWIITDKQTYTQTQLTKQVIRTVIRPINVPATEAAKLVQSMTTPNVGKIDVDARTNQLIVTDLPVVVAAIRDAVKLLDQKVYTRVFTIKHADAQKVMDILQEYKSPPGKLELIPRMRQIVAEDTFENIQRMEVMVNILDRGPEMRVYDLNSLDVAGERIKDLQGYFEKEIITEGAYMQFDLQNGVMILIDLPHVHEKVQKILDAVDRPPRQVYIQAEIVETSFKHSFSIGLDTGQFADNLFVSDPLGGETSQQSSTTGGSNVPPSQTSGLGGLGGLTGGATTLDFIDLAAAAAKQANARYPVFGADASGFKFDYLSRTARLVFAAVMKDNETRVLAQPRILVKNREIGAFTDGGTMSYATTTYYGGGYGGYGQYNQGGYGGYVPSVAPGSIPTGVNLMVEPTVMNNGLIEIHVTLDNVSGTRNPTKLAGQDYDLVDTTNQNIDTTLVIPDGQTRMIGGMIENRETESTQGIPYLKDIPFIGPIVFGKKTQDPISRRTLLMFISPTVVQEETRKYATPPDESEMTPPTFYEQASWSAAAVKRAVEKAMKQAESEYGVSMPAAGAKVTEAPEAALAPVALEHGETTKTVGREKPTSPALPAAERQPTTKPVELTPLATPILPEPKPPATTSTPPQAEKRPAVKAASPTKQLGEKPPSPAAKVTTPTTTGKLSAKVAPQPIGRTVSDKSEVSRTSPSLERIAVPGAKLPDQTKKLELPTTGTVMLESGPPAVVLSSRRPGDLPLPRAPVLGPVGLVESKPAGSTSQPAEISSYEVTVIGPDGLPATAEPSGQWLQPVALGTLPIPAELLAPAGSAAAAALVAVPAGTAPPAAPRLGTILFGGAQGTAPVPVQPGVGAVRPPSAAPPPGYVARPATTPYGTATVASPYGAPVPARPALSARPTPYSPYARPPVPIPFR